MLLSVSRREFDYILLRLRGGAGVRPEADTLTGQGALDLIERLSKYQGSPDEPTDAHLRLAHLATLEEALRREAGKEPSPFEGAGVREHYAREARETWERMRDDPENSPQWQEIIALSRYFLEAVLDGPPEREDPCHYGHVFVQDGGPESGAPDYCINCNLVDT